MNLPNQPKNLTGPNEPGAFENFYKTEFNGLFRLAFLYCQNKDLALETLQDAFVNYLRASKSHDGVKEPLSYLRKSIRQRALRLKYQAKLSEKQKREWLRRSSRESNQNQNGLKIEKAEEYVVLRRALDDLPFEIREPVLLHIQNSLTFEEIGRMTDTPAGTVSARYYKGMEKLKAKLEK